ncbi:hypothetical protein [Parabacteroides sp.]
MMKKIVLLFSLAVTLLLTACGPREIPAKGDFFTVSIPEAAGIDGNKLNYWLVSAYLVWEK